MKRKTSLVTLMALVLLAVLVASGLAAEKLKYGTSVKGVPSYEVPVITAEEKGFWKQQGLDSEWIPFSGSSELGRGIVVGEVQMGTLMTIPALLAAGRGVPLVLVASLNIRTKFSVFVRGDSSIKQPKELQDRIIGVPRLKDTTSAYASKLSDLLGIKVRQVGVGSVAARMAALKSGSIDALISGGGGPEAELIVKGEIRELLSLDDYFPKPWDEYFVFARKGWMDRNVDLVRRAIRAMLQSGDFIRENPSWVLELMKKQYGFSDAAGKKLYAEVFKEMGGRGKIDPKGIENVRNFLIEYGLIERDKAPSVDEVHTTKFIN